MQYLNLPLANLFPKQLKILTTTFIKNTYKNNNMTKIIACSNLIEKDGKFLLVKETKKMAKGSYNFPSGTLEDNESLIDCAIREAKEESGLTVKPVSIVKLFHNPKSARGNSVLIVVFNSKTISGELTTSKEHPEVKFASLEEIKELNKNNLIRHGEYMLDAIDNYLNNKSIDLDFLGGFIYKS